MSKTYSVELEIAGPIGMFSRPDAGGAATSYPAPTFSAAKGIFESIARLHSGDAWIRPTKVEICREVGTEDSVNFQNYATNYGGPLRKANQLSSGSSFQFFATVLANPCYRIYGEVVGPKRASRSGNPRHYLQDLYNRRLKQGRCFRTPCLGWSEFTASYWGRFRDESHEGSVKTEVDSDLNFTIPSMFHEMFDQPVDGTVQPRFSQNIRIKKGTLIYAE